MVSQVSLDPKVLQLLNRSGLTTEAQSAVIDGAARSPYFAGMLNDAIAKNIAITVGTAGGGTYTQKKDGTTTIVIDPKFDPGKQTDTDKNIDKNPDVFATAVAHELGHALLPGGNEGPPKNNPDQAEQVGANNEGVALTAEYIVATQLGLGTSQPNVYMHSDNGQAESNGANGPGTLSSQLNAAAVQMDVDLSNATYKSQDASAFTQINSLGQKDAAIFNGQQTPSGMSISYREYYRDWNIIDGCSIAGSNGQGVISPRDVDWSKMVPGNLGYASTTNGACTFDGIVPLLPKTANSSGQASAHITGTMSPTGPSSIDISVDANGDGNFDQNVDINETGDGGVTYKIVNADGTWSEHSDDGQGSTSDSSYDASGRLVQEATSRSDGSSFQTHINNYDVNGNITSVVDVASKTDEQGVVIDTTTTTNYDPTTGAETSHNVSTDDGHGDTSNSAYDANGNPTSYSWQTEGGGSGSNTYGANGAVINSSWADGNGNSGSNTYGADGTLESSTWKNAEGNSGTNTYDASGKVVSDTWANANGTTGTDEYGVGGASSGTVLNTNGSSSTYQDDGQGNRTTKDYAPNGTLISEQDVTAQADNQGDVIKTTTTTNYDSNTGVELGHNVSTDDGHGDTSNSAYDANGALTSSTWADRYGNSSSDTYGSDGSDNYTWHSAAGNSFTAVYDVNGNCVSDTWAGNDGSKGSDQYGSDGSSSGSQINADGSSSTYQDDGQGHSITDSYAANGNISSVQDVTSLTDEYGFVSTTTTITTSYDPNNGAETGHSVSIDDGHGDTTTSNYDANGVLASKTWVDVNGNSGTDTYGSDGSSSGSVINANGSSSTYQDDGHGNRKTDDYASNGNISSEQDVSSNTDSQGNVTTVTTTTSYDSVTGVETGHSLSNNDGHGDISTSTYDANGDLISYRWQTEGGGSGSNIYNANGVLASTTWADGNGNSGSNYYDVNGNLASDTWSSPSGVTGTDTYGADGSRVSNTWQSPDGSYGSDTVNPDGSTSNTTVTPGNDGSITSTTIETYPASVGYGGDYGGGYGGDYGGDYGSQNGYQVTTTTTTNLDGSSSEIVTTNQNGYNDTTTTFTAIDGSFTASETNDLGEHSSRSYNATTPELDTSTYKSDGSHTDTQQIGSNFNSDTYDANGNVIQTQVETATSSVVTTNNSDGSQRVDSRTADSNGISWTETIDSRNSDGSHSETQISEGGNKTVTDNYDANGNLTSETGHYDWIQSSDWVGGYTPSDWQTTYNSAGASTTVETEGGDGQTITHTTVTNALGNTISSTTETDVYGVINSITLNADGSRSTASNDGEGNSATHSYDAYGNDIHDTYAYANGSTDERTYDPDARTVIETSSNGTGDYSTYESYYDESGGEYKQSSTIVGSDGTTQTSESYAFDSGWLTESTGPGGTAYSLYTSQNETQSLTVDQYNSYLNEILGPSNDPYGGSGGSGTGNSGTSDPGADTVTMTDIVVGVPEQQAA